MTFAEGLQIAEGIAKGVTSALPGSLPGVGVARDVGSIIVAALGTGIRLARLGRNASQIRRAIETVRDLDLDGVDGEIDAGRPVE